MATRQKSSRTGLAVGLFVFGGAVVASMIAACANVTAPEGGPEDRDAPMVVKITPADGAVGVKPKDVVIQFSEVISETPRGSQDLSTLVFISPKAGKPNVDWLRSRIAIHPKKGWKPNTVYSITVSPGISDLRQNVIDSTIRVVFSTGGAIPQTHITGVVFDWTLGRGANKALVEAIAADSTTYQVLSDTAGRYDLRYMPPGKYTVRAIADRNNNRDLDPSEAWDTLGVTFTADAAVELYIFPHDTIGLRISDMTLLDSGRVVKITFDKPYPPTQVFDLSSVSIKQSDSSFVSIAKIQPAQIRLLFDSLARKAKEDSAAKNVKVDTSVAARARADSAARKRRLDSIAVAERADREARRLAVLRGNRPLPPRDTMPLPKMHRPQVYTDIYVTLVEPLPPGRSFRVQANKIQSLSGTLRSPARTLNTPKAEKRDSTATKPDGKPPAGTPPPGTPPAGTPPAGTPPAGTPPAVPPRRPPGQP